MAPFTRSRVSIPSAARISCSTCKRSFHNPFDAKKHSAQRTDAHRIKIILRVKTTCPACKATSGEPLGRNNKTYWTKKKFQEWAEPATLVTVNSIVLKKKRYIVKFHQGTTLRLRHGARVSILRIPNRWTRVNGTCEV